MKLTFKHTLVSCFISYITQAIILNFIPLLFITFQNDYGLPLSQITLLVTVNFMTQLVVDATAPLYVDRIGYRPCVTVAHFFVAAGLLLLTVLPEIMPAFPGMMICVVLYGMGCGMMEVLISPITESCPTDNKEKAMALLHSFYCWGSMGVVLLSTVFFSLAGVGNWKILAGIWALIPLINGFLFANVPINTLIAEGEQGMKLKELLRSKTLWILLLMMLCAGASEHAVTQWASAFVEKGLGVSKTIGDLAGPMAFAALMGITRIIFVKFGGRIGLDRFIAGGSLLCVAAYLLIVLVPDPVVNLIGCGLCGIGVAILWPGTLSKAASALRTGGTTMFALLAVAGDFGCTAGPTVVGWVSGAAGDNLKAGILSAILFPLLLIPCILFFRKKQTNRGVL